jgi:EAL domain-containing protein (putative c-di-GMP-specific phosphodiesterase class I)/CheY-like chemotaxis protein
MANTVPESLGVLAIDDDTFMLNLIGVALKGLGVDTIKCASTGASALEALTNSPEQIDLLICDLNMPGMDGIEFLRHLAEREFRGSVALISGEDPRILKTAETLARAHDLNLLGTFSKPITRETLAGILEHAGESRSKGAHGPAEPISEEELSQGIHGDELTVFFQPKVSVTTRDLVGVEALVRWQHATRGLVFPDAFIPVAEKFNLIDKLTDVVFVKSMKQGGEWLAEGMKISVSVNISVDSLDRLSLPRFIVKKAEEQGMDPSHIMLELTESRLMEDIKKPLEILSRLRLKGIGLSIDDFGTGHSSMEQLKRIPFTELKIDRAFVNGAMHDKAARAILEFSVTLAKKLGMTIVAEGVETQEDWDLVAALECDLVQGYFIAKPMPGNEIKPWYETYKANLG